jgi:HAD superfamily hydrolase (TIGR01490 family)
MEMKMIGAFFDVDGTLYSGNMWRGLVQYATEHGRKTRAQLYMARNMSTYYLRKLKLIDEERFRKPWVTSMGWLVQGWNAAQGESAFRWVAKEYIEPTGQTDVIARLRQHVAQGHIVVLVSAMLAPTLRVLGDTLGVTGTVGTEVEFVNGLYTGRVILPICMGVEKGRLTRAFLQARGLDIDFASSFAYADSFSDMSLFDLVGHPVAVQPDPLLAAHARAKTWEIIPAS